MEAAAYPNMKDEDREAVWSAMRRELSDEEMERLHEQETRAAKEQEWAANRARFGAMLAAANRSKK